MRLNSGTVSNVAFTLACLMFIALGGLRLKESLTKPNAPPGRQPNAVQDIKGVDVSISDAERSLLRHAQASLQFPGFVDAH